MAGLVLAVIAECVTLLAVTVWLPAVAKVTLNAAVPAASAALAGRVAPASLDVIFTVSFVLIMFQFGSTALTVTLNGMATVCVAGDPVLPEAVPGAAVSPGTNNCSLL